MDGRQIGLGIVLFLVFWAYQVGYADGLGTAAWFLGAVIFVVILMAMGKFVMPKPPQDIKNIWNFAIIFALIGTFIISFLGPMLGAVLPSNPAQVTPLVLSFWLVIFGGALFAGGYLTKNGLGLLIGVIWLFTALHFVTAIGTGPNTYIHFAYVTGFSFIIAGIIAKKR